MERRYKNTIMKKLLIFSTFLTLLFSCSTTEKTAYIDMDKMFNEFELTKQKKAEYENVLNKRKEVGDKERLRLQQAYNSLSEIKNPPKSEVEKFQIDRQIFEQKMQEDEQQNKAMDDQYTSEIWKQLNQYIEDFRKEEGYTYLFIKNNIVADESKDVSKEAVDFVNKRFKGEK